MILQSSLRHHNASLSSTLSYSLPLPPKYLNFTLPRTLSSRRQKLPIIIVITCSFSQIHSYGTVDYERRPMIKWNSIYRRISLMETPELGAGTVLNQFEKEGKKLTKWELCRVVKELRKFKRFNPALEVYDWMSNRGERFRLSASDAAIQLDLIAKVRGVSTAELFFEKLPDNLKDRRIYGALLNAYVQAKTREKAESLMDKMRNKGYITHALPFNVMMTLYMNLKEYDKVDSMISEMMDKNIPLDLYSYNIWLSSHGLQASAEKMGQVFEQMKQDGTINPNWTTFSTMASMYIRMGQIEKAEDCLRRVESRITGRDRIPYHYLLSLYGNVGNKEEVLRVWKTYKSVFPTIPNLGYHAIISSLVRIGDIQGAERMYQEWLSVKSSLDPRIVNLLMGWYVKEGNLDRAESFFEDIAEGGGKPNAYTWEILAEGHTRESRISEASYCWKEAFAAEGSKSWKANPLNVSSFFKVCEEENDMASKEGLEGLLRQSGCLDDKEYASLIGLYVSGDEMQIEKDGCRDKYDNEENENDERSEMLLLNQLQGDP